MDIEWIQISSGRGPEECCWLVTKLIPLFIKDGQQHGLKVQLLEVDETSGSYDKSALLSIEGVDIESFLSQWEGTVQWVGESPMRPRHKRRNWFVGIKRIPLPDMSGLDEKAFRTEVKRASGPGGQHVNKTESAVRITHVPTGISAVAQEERSQARNRQLAFARLQKKLDEMKNNKFKKIRQSKWNHHDNLTRGNAVRIYEGKQLTLRRV